LPRGSPRSSKGAEPDVPDRLDSRRFKIAATLAVSVVCAVGCLLEAQRAIAYQRGVRGGALYVAGDPARAYPYLVNAARAPLMGRLNAAPLLDLGEVATWAIDDPRMALYQPRLTPEAAARLAFVSHAEALERNPTSTRAMAGLADLFRRVQVLNLKRSVPTLGELVPPPRSAEEEPESPEERLVVAAYRRAIEMEPANYFWYAYLADFLEERGRHAEALPLYESAIELMPSLSWHYYLGTTGPLPADMFAVARAGLERALKTNVVFRPEKIESNIGYLYERQRDYDQALQHYRRAIELAHDPSEYLYQAATIFVFKRQPGNAMEYFKRALSRGTLNDRQRLESYRRMGMLSIDGHPGEAVDYLRRALALDPSSYETRIDLARALLAAGNEDGAESEAGQARSLRPARSEAYDFLIDLYVARGDEARAIPLARRLTELYPSNDAYRERLDDLYRRMGGRTPE